MHDEIDFPFDFVQNLNSEIHLWVKETKIFLIKFLEILFYLFMSAIKLTKVTEITGEKKNPLTDPNDGILCTFFVQKKLYLTILFHN